MDWSKFNKLPRMTKTALLAVLLFVAVFLISPQQVGVIVYKVALVFLAGVAGYVLDRALFPYARPHAFENKDVARPQFASWSALRVFFAAQYRRAAIVAAAMLAVGLGL